MEIATREEILESLKPGYIILKHCYGNYEDVYMTLESVIRDVEEEEKAKVVGFTRLRYSKGEMHFKVVYFDKIDGETSETMSEYHVIKLK